MLEHEPQHYLELPAFYQAKRDRFCALLAETRFKLLDVPGGYFQLVDYSDIQDTDDIHFSQWLLKEAGVVGIPLTPFYETPPASRFLRLCFAKNDATLDAAIERLRNV